MIASARAGSCGRLGRVSTPTSRMFSGPSMSSPWRCSSSGPNRSCCSIAYLAWSTSLATSAPPEPTSSRAPNTAHNTAQMGVRRPGPPACATIRLPEPSTLPDGPRDRPYPMGGSGAVHQLVGVALQILQPTAHEERLLGEVVVLTLGQLLERFHGLLHRHERALHPGELLRREGVLGEEPLDPARPVHRDLVFLAQLVHTQDRDEGLQVLVALEGPLHLRGGRVVFGADGCRGNDR